MANTKKLHRLSDVTLPCGCDSADSVERHKAMCEDDRKRALEILMEAQGYYNAMYKFRVERERNNRYNFGDQWGDRVNVDGESITEEEYIKRQGSVPLKTNLIRRLVRSVVGVYRSQSKEPTCTARDRKEQMDAEVMSTVLQCNMQVNRTEELMARTFEDYLIGGLAVHKKWHGWRRERMDCWTDYVQPNNVILDSNMRDIRGWDCSFIGEIHDLSFEELCSEFANSPEDYVRLSSIYKSARDFRVGFKTWEDFGVRKDNLSIDFLVPSDMSRCRVIEVWRKESRPCYKCHDYNTGDYYRINLEDYQEMVVAENERRRIQGINAGMNEGDIPYIKAEFGMPPIWYYYFISPMGDILAEGETPYEHKGHPYVFKAYPFLNGEIHSFVSDVVDTQRYVNRMITLNDFIVRSSAKGVLLVPQDCIPKGMSPETFADEWTKFNGCVVYTPSKTGAVPQQISSNSTNVGVNEMLSLQLKFFEDISGVNNSLQGKQGFSGTSASLYSQQTQNATMSLLDVLDSFQEFVLDSAYMDIKNITQFYDDKREIEISGSKTATYDPDKIRDLEFDVSIVPSQTTPTYRAIQNEFLMQLFSAQAISVEQLLEVGDFPFADQLLQSIRVQREQIEKGQVPDGVSPQVMQQVNEGANQNAVNLLQ